MINRVILTSSNAGKPERVHQPDLSPGVMSTQREYRLAVPETRCIKRNRLICFWASSPPVQATKEDFAECRTRSLF
jgi:hypothetical protein